MRSYLIYCEFVLCTFIMSHRWGESNLRWHKKTIILKNNFKLQIELMIKTDKNIVVKYRFELHDKSANCG